MEFDRSQIFAPVKADTVPRFAQRPRPAAPGLVDQLPSTNIGRTKNNDRLRVLVRGVPDHVTSEEVEKHLILPFADLVESWYLVRQNFVADLDLDLDHNDTSVSNTRVYVQLHNREGVQKFHLAVNGDFNIAKKWPKPEISDSETISDSIPHPLQVEFSPLAYFAVEGVKSEIEAGSIESDPLYIKFCENPDQLLFEGGEGRVLEPIIAPTEFEVDSIVPVGVPLAKIDIPENELVMLPEEKKPTKKKAKKGKEKKENKEPKKETKSRDASTDSRESPARDTPPRDSSSRESTPSEDKKKKRTRKKKPAEGAAASTAVPGAPGTTSGTPAASTTTSATPAASSAPSDSMAKPKKKKAREPREPRDNAPKEPRDATPREPRDTAPKEGAPAAPRKAKKKTEKPKPKPEAKADAKDTKEPKPKQQPGKENQPKPKPKPPAQGISIPQTTQSASGTAENKPAPKKKRTRSKKPAAAANGTTNNSGGAGGAGPAPAS